MAALTALVYDALKNAGVDEHQAHAGASTVSGPLEARFADLAKRIVASSKG